MIGGVMKFFALFCTLCLAPNAALAQNAPSARIPVFNNPIPNIPGKSIVAVVVDLPPGVTNPPHHHAHSAFTTAYVLEGAVRNQIDDGPVKVYHAGEYYTENPGSYHRLSENASKTEPAKLLAIFVVDTGDMPITMLDKPITTSDK